MKFDDYQEEALKTDQVPYREAVDTETAGKIVPLLGLASETGELLSEYKKFIRDGKGHRHFREHVEEELGDLLWYISNVASKFDLKLSEIARKNLTKTRERWGGAICSTKNLDEGFQESERFPRKFVVELRKEVQEGQDKVQPYIDEVSCGDGLTDNFREDDGYRFHDVFHFAYVAVLGWSPVIRKLMERKRKSDKKYDEVEDGGRAIVIDEAIVALAFRYATDHGFLTETSTVDFQLLKTIKSMTDHLEVSERTTGDWEKAIVDGFNVWRQVIKNGGGRMSIDMDARKITFLSE